MGIWDQGQVDLGRLSLGHNFEVASHLTGKQSIVALIYMNHVPLAFAEQEHSRGKHKHLHEKQYPQDNPLTLEREGMDSRTSWLAGKTGAERYRCLQPPPFPS